MSEAEVSWDTFLRETVRRYSTPGETKKPEGSVLRVVVNAACGDRVGVYRTGRGIELYAEGCAICRAAAAVAGEAIGRVGERIDTLAHDVIRGIRGELSAETVDLGGALDEELSRRLSAFFVLADYPGRQRCATLPWEALLETREGDSEHGRRTKSPPPT